MKIKINQAQTILIMTILLISLSTFIVFEKIEEIANKPILVLLLTNILLPVFVGLIILLVKYFISENFDRKIISEHENGFKNIDDNFKWNHSEPLEMLFVNLHKDFLPKSLTNDLHKFEKIHIALDHSEKTTEARSVALDKENFRDDGFIKTQTFLNFLKDSKMNEKVKIVEINKKQYPFGIMIHNDKTIFYSPLWNHSAKTDGAVEDVFLKIPSASKLGRMMTSSFKVLFDTGKVIGNYDVNLIKDIHIK
jgi:hypothetical protein